MRYTILILPVLLLIGSCGGDSGTNPEPNPEPTYTVVAETPIDAAGGTVGNENVSVEVPAGAFAAEAVLTIQASNDDRPFGSAGDGVTYRVEGIPDDFSAPLTVHLRPSAPIDDEPLIGFGTTGMATSTGEEHLGYRVLPATAVGDTVVTFEIEPVDAAGKNVGLPIAAAFLYLIGYDSYLSENEHFLVAYPSGVTGAQAGEVGGMLENAYNELGAEGLGFSYANRTQWPIYVAIKELDSTLFGLCTVLPNGYNAGWLELNSLKLAEAEEMQRTIAHEFFHLVQSWQYPALSFTVHKYLWLEEACSVWSEGLFTDDQDFVSTIRAGNEIEPYYGLANTVTSGTQLHGYGMSSVIKHLVDAFGEAIVPEIFEGVTENESTAACLINAVSSHEGVPVWWQDFLIASTENEVYPDMPAAQAVSSLVGGSQRFRIEDDDDRSMTFTKNMMDLSGAMYRIDTDKDTWDPDEILTLTLSGDGGLGSLTAWSYGSGPLVRLAGPTYGDLEIGDLQAIKDANRDIVVLLVNGNAMAPYTDKRDISLQVELAKPPPEFDVTTANRAVFEVTVDAQISNASSELHGYTIHAQANVSWSNGALRCATENDSFTIVVDPETYELGAWSAVDKYTSIGGTWYVKRLAGTGGFSLSDWDENTLIYRITGPEVCDHLTRVFQTEARDDETPPYSVLTSWSCSDLPGDVWGTSRIYVHLWKTE